MCSVTTPNEAHFKLLDEIDKQLLFTSVNNSKWEILPYVPIMCLPYELLYTVGPLISSHLVLALGSTRRIYLKKAAHSAVVLFGTNSRRYPVTWQRDNGSPLTIFPPSWFSSLCACAAKALFSCPAIISQRLESRIISNEPLENTEEESKII